MSKRVYEGNDITAEVVKAWGYDQELLLMEQDEELLLYDIELIPALLALAGDDACPKSEAAFFILCQFCRELVVRDQPNGVGALKEVLEHLPIQTQGLSKQWHDYVLRLLSYRYAPKPLSRREAHQLAHDLLIGIAGRVGTVSTSEAPDARWWRFKLTTSVIEHIDICRHSGRYRYVPEYPNLTT